MRRPCLSSMTDAQAILKQIPLYSDNTLYVMISLPPIAITPAAGILAEIGEPFGALIVDKYEVSLIIAAEDYQEFSRRLPDARLSQHLRLITFDQSLPPDLTGFMAFIGQLLGQAGILIIPIGAFDRDHVLVPAAHFEKAWQVLKDYQK